MAGYEYYVENWDYAFFLFLRVSALVFSSPIFGRNTVPAMAKIGLCLAVTFVFFNALPQEYPLDYNDDLIIFVLLCVTELLFGLIMGYVLNVFLTLTFTAGQIMDMQMGFGMVNVFDVQSNLSVPVTGNILNIMTLMVFFIVDGHLRLIETLYVTVQRIPIGTVTLSPALGLVAIELFVRCFVLAVYVAMPIVASGMIGEISLGIMIKTVPQMNAFTIGLPMKVLLGLLVLSFIFPVYVDFMDGMFDELYAGLDNMFAALAG